MQPAQQQSEAQRFERLRAQDGKPLLPPPSMQGLVARGGLDPAKLQEARQMWEATRAEAQSQPSFPTEERLFWTTFLLARHYAEHQARPQAMELIHGTLQLLQDHRHRQTVLGLGARNAAVLGDVATADQYVAALDPRSDDLQVDTNYRFSAAYVALVKGDAQTVLHVLGSQIDDVPINDAYDAVCGVLRAHAHEMTGQLQIAQDQLMRFGSSADGLQRLEDIARSNPQLNLVPQSLPPVAQRVRQMHQNVIVTKSGINMKAIFIVPILGVAVAMGAQGLSTMVPGTLGAWLPGLLITAVVLASIGIVFKTIFKGAAVRKKLARTGLPGTGQLLVIEQTGTRVNDQPMVRFRMLVQVQGKSPYTVQHNEVVPLIRLRELAPGATVNVRVDPQDPAMMAIMWN